MKKEINAILDSDLDGVLAKLGLSYEFHHGKLKCKFCKIAIDSKSIYSIFPESGDVKLVCRSQECIDKFHRHLESRKYGDV